MDNHSCTFSRDTAHRTFGLNIYHSSNQYEDLLAFAEGCRAPLPFCHHQDDLITIGLPTQIAVLSNAIRKKKKKSLHLLNTDQILFHKLRCWGKYLETSLAPYHNYPLHRDCFLEQISTKILVCNVEISLHLKAVIQSWKSSAASGRE